MDDNKLQGMGNLREKWKRPNRSTTTIRALDWKPDQDEDQEDRKSDQGPCTLLRACTESIAKPGKPFVHLNPLPTSILLQVWHFEVGAAWRFEQGGRPDGSKHKVRARYLGYLDEMEVPRARLLGNWSCPSFGPVLCPSPPSLVLPLIILPNDVRQNL